MHIQSLFLRKMVSAVIGKALQKAGCKVDISLNDLRVNHTDQNKKLRVHLDIDAEMSEGELMDILKKAGVV